MEISVRAEDLRSMLTAMDADETLHWCSTCGAWIECDSPALATTEDFVGCWKIATGGDAKWNHLCVSQRGTMIDELKLIERDSAPSQLE